MNVGRLRHRAGAVACTIGLLVLAAPTASHAAVRRAVRGVHFVRITSPCAPATPSHPSCQELVRRPATAASANDSYVVRRAYTAGPAGGYTPGDLQTAYGLASASASAGAGQTVAVVDAYNDPTIASDLATFDANYGLPACGAGCLNIYNQAGQAAPLPATNTGWDGEIALDVETVHSICELCTIDLIEATNNSSANLGAAENEAVALGADEVSNSFGSPESPDDPTAADYNHPGVAIFASAGDEGYEDWDNSSDNLGVPNVPAALPTVIAVGGTSLQLNADDTRAGETVWNDDDGMQDSGGGSGGGGCSSLFTAQPWQTAVPDWSATGCGTHRLVADVSAIADPLFGFDTYDSQNGGWNTIGGTSLSSPLVAAVTALAGGPGGIDYPARTLYAHFAATPTAFNDVTSGGNGQCDGAYSGGTCADGSDYDSTTDCGGTLACNAGPGYDGPTGVGTPNGIAGFIAASPTAAIAPPASAAAGTAAAFSGAGSAPPAGATLTGYSWSFGDGATGSGAQVSHVYTAPGTYTVTLTVTDGGGRTATTTAVVSVVKPPPRASHGRLRQHGSTITIPLSCSVYSNPCHLRVTITTRIKVRRGHHVRHERITLASGSKTVSPGKTVILRLKLTRAAQRLLGHSGLRATVTVTGRDGTGVVGARSALKLKSVAARHSRHHRRHKRR